MTRKLTKTDFITKARKVHGDKYDYSKVEYKNYSTKICIICPIHGEFWQTPNNHLNGQNCPQCNGKIKLTTEEFIERAKEIHGDKYDYSKVKYEKNDKKVCIICPIHGEFWQTPKTHLNGVRCPKCYGKAKLNTQEFIKRAKEVHGDKYDYSKVKYVDAHTKVRIICPIHGEFLQRPCSHLNGQGCKKCSGNEKLTTEYFIERAKTIHGNKYDYSKVKYVNNRMQVCIVCPTHGEFWQTPHEHLSGYGCLLCGQEISKNSRRLTTEEFIKRARKIHGDKYDYSKVEYINTETQVCIICPIHGEFWQTPHSHLCGTECPHCANEIYTREERLYNFLLNNIKGEIIRWKKFKWLKYKNPMSLDLFIPSKKIGIEYQGVQHFKPVSFLGGEKEHKDIFQRDIEKIELCKKNGIKLLHFTFNEKDCKNWKEYKVYTNINQLINEINGSN